MPAPDAVFAFIKISYKIFYNRFRVIRVLEELFSLSMRSFQQAKQSGKMVCFKCFEEDGLVNFFLEGAWLSQHFRIVTLLSTVRKLLVCKAVFQDRHGEETARVVERLGRLRLQWVSILFVMK